MIESIGCLRSDRLISRIEMATLLPRRATAGSRAYDILQVAAALLISATGFSSFDGKRRVLAQSEGWVVKP